MTEEYARGYYDGMLKAAELVQQSGWVKLTHSLAESLRYAAAPFSQARRDFLHRRLTQALQQEDTP